jgi:putative ABC transport system permease protein
MNLKMIIVSVWRKIKFNKTFSLLNIVGLGIGLSVAVIVFLYVNYELSFDKFNKNADRIYMNVYNSDNLNSAFAIPFSGTFQAEVPEVEAAANILPWKIEKSITTSKGEFVETCQYMDEGIFSIFSFEIIRQTQQTIFPDANSVAICESLAKKLFGSADLAIGKSITVDKKNTCTISTIYKDIPSNSSVRFNMAAPLLTAINEFGITVNWSNGYVHSFAKLKVPLDLAKSNIANFSKKYGEFVMFPLTELHLAQKGNEQKTTLAIAILSSIFVMLLACINFINLSTANIFKRNKEVGINKILGSSAFNLYKQFIAETLMLTVIALLLALLITSLLLPYINQVIGVDLAFNQLNPFKLILLLSVISGTSLLTAIVPSYIFTKTKPVQIFNKQLDRNNTAVVMRKGLLILQLSLTIIIITATLFINKQVHFISKSNLGFDKENMVFIEAKDTRAMVQKAALFKEKLLQCPFITSVSAVDCQPGIIGSSTTGGNWPGKNQEEQIPLYLFRVSGDFVKTFGINLIEGTDFNGQSEKQGVIINKTLANKIEEDGSTSNKLLYLWGRQFNILGVIDDFSFNSIKEKQQASVIFYEPSRGFFPCIRYGGAKQVPQVLAYINKSMAGLFPDMQYKINFTNDFVLDEFMSREIRLSKFFSLFSVLGVVVCSLGLLGVALFESHKRTKEIGIRKVNGALIAEILALLNKDFIQWFVIAFMIAVPVSFYVMNKWLESFTFKTSLSWWVFALSGVLTLGIALLTVSWQSWKAATRNPVEVLRYE